MSDNLLIFLYDESGSPIGMQYRNGSYAADTFVTFFFEKNLQGDIIAIYNEDGIKVLSYTYDAWGNHTTTWHYSIGTNMVAQYNPFRYRGYYYDTETGWYYLQSRYYNPKWGRFLNADGYVNANGDLIGFNMYAYCSNNPVMYADYTGEDAIYLCSTSLPVVGHAAVFIEVDDVWYLFQFADEKKFKKRTAKVSVEPIGNYEQVKKRIEKHPNSKSIYLSGGFTASYSKAVGYLQNRGTNGYDGEYCLFDNNCLHLVLDILSAGSCFNPAVNKAITDFDGIVPIGFYWYLYNVVEATKPCYSGAGNFAITKDSKSKDIQYYCSY